MLTSLVLPGGEALAASAAECEQVSAIATTGSAAGLKALVTLPPALGGVPGDGISISACQGARPLEVEVEPIMPSASAMAVVLDTSTETATEARESLGGAAVKLMAQLEPGTETALVTAGGRPAVVAGPTQDRDMVIAALALTRTRPGRSTIESVASAIDVLKKTAASSRDLVLLTGGSDTRSRRTSSSTLAALRDASVTMQWIEGGGSAGSDPLVGGSCPAGGRTGYEAATKTVSERIVSRYAVTVAGATADADLTLRVVAGKARTTVVPSPRATAAAPDGSSGSRSVAPGLVDCL